MEVMIDLGAHSANERPVRDFFFRMLRKSKIKYTMHSAI